MVDMNHLAKLAMSFEGKHLGIKNIPGPEGVRGRNSDNDRIKKVLGWAPSISLAEGLRTTYYWIKQQIEEEHKKGVFNDYSSSKVVQQSTESLDQLAHDGSGDRDAPHKKLP